MLSPHMQHHGWSFQLPRVTEPIEPLEGAALCLHASWLKRLSPLRLLWRLCNLNGITHFYHEHSEHIFDLYLAIVQSRVNPAYDLVPQALTLTST